MIHDVLPLSDDELLPCHSRPGLRPVISKTGADWELDWASHGPGLARLVRSLSLVWAVVPRWVRAPGLGWVEALVRR